MTTGAGGEPPAPIPLANGSLPRPGALIPAPLPE